MKIAKIKRMLVALIVATSFSAIFMCNVLYSVDNAFSDRLYQKKQILDGNVILINIDQRALETIGPFQTWGRGVIAEVIDTLNADENNRPAAIGVDVLFTGETDALEDEKLVQATSKYNNVLLATAANFESEVITKKDGSFSLDNSAIVAYDEPFEELKNVSEQGHINVMNDKDGILRHSILELDMPDGQKIPSFNYKIAQMYAKQMNMKMEKPLTDKSSRWYLPYKAIPGGFDDGFSVADVLEGNLPSDLFKDKIVLIGPYAAGLNDTVKTPIDHVVPMYGVEYQANAITAILDGNFKQEVSLIPQAIILFVISFVLVVWFHNRKMLSATLGWALLLVASIGIPLICWKMDYVVKTLYLPIAITILYIVSVASNYIHAALEKKRVTTTFQRYVAPEIVNEILKEGSESLGLGGKLTDIAVLFVDIRGFTTMSEILEAPQVVEILNRYLTLTSECILKNNGTLDKFVGDCTMAFWGAPLPQEDIIFKAVKTALDMVEGSKALSEELQAKFGRTVSFGIGVHYGPAVVGNIGAPNRMDYTAIGDTVNTSARLEANAPGGKILISRVVADALEDRINFTSLGDTIKLKGKAAGFEILTVEGLKDVK